MPKTAIQYSYPILTHNDLGVKKIEQLNCDGYYGYSDDPKSPFNIFKDWIFGNWGHEGFLINAHYDTLKNIFGNPIKIPKDYVTNCDDKSATKKQTSKALTLSHNIYGINNLSYKNLSDAFWLCCLQDKYWKGRKLNDCFVIRNIATGKNAHYNFQFESFANNFYEEVLDSDSAWRNKDVRCVRNLFEKTEIETTTGGVKDDYTLPASMTKQNLSDTSWWLVNYSPHIRSDHKMPLTKKDLCARLEYYIGDA